MEESLIVVDDIGRFLDYASYEECHVGQGRRHRAFVTLLFDKDNWVFLHRRRHKLFNGLWDLTAISHPLYRDGKNESYQEASDRALAKEIGISHVPVEKIGAFCYFARDGKNCENEYCTILVGKYNGKVRPNKNEVYEVKQVAFNQFVKDIGKNPAKYTPWAKLAAKQIASRQLLVVNRLALVGFKDELSNFLGVFEPYVKSYFEKKIKEVSRYPKLIGEFYKDLADFTVGGKKLRAFLIFLGYKVADGRDFKKILPIALAYELLHSFLLIHDDIIDQSDTRRGKRTIHKRYEKLFGPSASLRARNHYGVSQAIILGDIACFEALGLVSSSELSESQKVVCQKQLIATILETGYGEALDVEYAYRGANLKAIWQVTDLKSARYSFVGPLTIGAKLAGGKSSQLDALSKFGQAVGKAFQIQDDILGVFGDEKITGKSSLLDLREGKNTLLIYKTREVAKGQDKDILAKLWGNQNARLKDLKKVRQLIVNSGALDWSSWQKQKLIKAAKLCVGQITKDNYLEQILVQMADFVIERQS